MFEFFSKKKSIEELIDIVNIKNNLIFWGNGDISVIYKVNNIFYDIPFVNNENKNILDIITLLKSSRNDISLNFFTKSELNPYEERKNYEKFCKFEDLKERRLKHYFESKENGGVGASYTTYYLGIRFLNLKNLPFEDFEFFIKGGIHPINKIFEDGLEQNIRKNFDGLTEGLITPLEDFELWKFIDFFLNPHSKEKDKYINLTKNPSIPLIRTFLRTMPVFEDDMLKFGDSFYAKVFNLRYPPSSKNQYGIFLFMDLISHLTKNNLEYMINIKFNVDNEKILEKEIKNKASFGQSVVATFFGNSNNKVADECKNYLTLKENLHAKDMNLSITISIFSNSKQKMINVSKDIENITNWDGALFLENKYEPLEEWFNCMPTKNTLSKFNVIVNNIHTTYLTNLFCFYNTNSNYFEFPMFNKIGNLCNFNPLNERQSLHSAFIIAPSRRGKSVYLNQLTLYFFLKHSIEKKEISSLILDYGESQKFLLEYVNTFLEENNKIVFVPLEIENTYYNIFDLPFNTNLSPDMISKKTQSLLSFFKIALEDIKPTDEALLSNLFEILYNKYIFNEDDDYPDLKRCPDTNNPYIYIYTEKFKGDKRNAYLKMFPTIEDLYTELVSNPLILRNYTETERTSLQEKIRIFKNSFEGKIFSNNSSRILSNRNSCYDFKNIFTAKNDKLNQLFLVYLIQTYLLNYRGEKNSKKLIEIDEWFQFVQNSSGGESSKSNYVKNFLENLLVTGAKDNINVYTASQSITHYDERLFNNVGYVFLFKPNDSNELNKIVNTFALTEEEAKALKSVNTVPGLYSEFMVIASMTRGMEKFTLKNIIPRFEYWLSATNAKERKIKEIYLDKYKEIRLAMSKLTEEVLDIDEFLEKEKDTTNLLI